jgi:WhiB family redox-sensing transcriptional regulator
MKLSNYFPGLPDFDTSSALCTQTDPDLFYPEAMHSTTTIATAKSICAKCPVQVECLTFALKTKETEGIWGGLTPKERFQLLKKTKGVELSTRGYLKYTNGRGRPRTNTNI